MAWPLGTFDIIRLPVPTSTTLTGSSGFYVPPLGVFRIRVQMVGGGAAGGAGDGAAHNGGDGSPTSFGGFG